VELGLDLRIELAQSRGLDEAEPQQGVHVLEVLRMPAAVDPRGARDTTPATREATGVGGSPSPAQRGDRRGTPAIGGIVAMLVILRFGQRLPDEF